MRDGSRIDGGSNPADDRRDEFGTGARRRGTVMDALATIRREGVTILLVEQDVNLALSIADRGYVMETGHIVRSGSAKKLIDDPEVRRAYLGL